MPLPYGESDNAFLRLQHTTAGQSSDQTLFAWPDPDNRISGIFHASPSAFSKPENLVRFDPGGDLARCSITKRGLHITIPIRNDGARLQCRRRDNINTITTIVLRQLNGKVYGRTDADLLSIVPYRAWEAWSNKTVYIMTTSKVPAGLGDGFERSANARAGT